ncbi:hypothetical protein [Vitiosangium sp. GDMCC 1.1324]|uniref:terpene synthase family protein n=1 Tax=Vitiosangium sp. (strain GDMCC 1.1324) TaxID=2138576 RepID=UPI0011B695C7|nr:hypothetical protein [Vitiosangium sp. GDMCC 1.1324]
MNDIEGEALERWAKYLGVHAKHSVFRKLQRSHFPVLLGRCHPGATKEAMRAALDFLIWNFSWDDQVDVGDVPAEWVRQQSEMALAVLKGAIPYHDAPPLLWLLASIRERISERMPAEWMERFIHSCHCYFKGTIWEAEVRSQRVCLDVDTYIELRRLSVGTYMGFTQVEAIEGFLLPESVLSHPAIAELIQTATDVIAWANDLFSLAQDLKDDFHPNLVFSIQKQHGLPLQEAIDRAVEMHDAAVRRFIELETSLPSFGEHDANVATLVSGVRRWIRANVDWSIQTGRYQEGGEAEAISPKSRVA